MRHLIKNEFKKALKECFDKNPLAIIFLVLCAICIVMMAITRKEEYEIGAIIFLFLEVLSVMIGLILKNRNP